MRILITGGTGLIGKAFISFILPEAEAIFVVSRKKRANQKKIFYFLWDGKQIPKEIPAVDWVINLAGEPILTKHWSKRQKQRLWDSRIWATEACVRFIERHPPQMFFSASAVGYYGTNPPIPKTEESPCGKDFLAQLASAWERKAKESPVEPTLLRFGIVLSENAIPFKQPYYSFKYLYPTYLKPGTQIMPWIAMEDVLRAMKFLWDHKVSGAINVVTPEPITHHEYASILAKLLRKPAPVGIPQWFMRLFFGERATILTKGVAVLPKRLTSLGFTFHHQSIVTLLRMLIQRIERKSERTTNEDSVMLFG